MKEKLDELQLEAGRADRALEDRRGAEPGADAVKSIDMLDPTSELGRFEDKVRREEALVAGKQELVAVQPRRAVRGTRNGQCTI